jgi:hypothetical protein
LPGVGNILRRVDVEKWVEQGARLCCHNRKFRDLVRMPFDPGNDTAILGVA